MMIHYTFKLSDHHGDKKTTSSNLDHSFIKVHFEFSLWHMAYLTVYELSGQVLPALVFSVLFAVGVVSTLSRDELTITAGRTQPTDPPTLNPEQTEEQTLFWKEGAERVEPACMIILI